MEMCTQLLPFLQALFDDPAVAQKAAMIGGRDHENTLTQAE